MVLSASVSSDARLFDSSSISGELGRVGERQGRGKAGNKKWVGNYYLKAVICQTATTSHAQGLDTHILIYSKLT